MAKTRQYRGRRNTSKFVLLQPLKNIFTSSKKKVPIWLERTKIYVRKNPMRSFFITLGILFVLMILNVILTPKPQENVNKPSVKKVAVYNIGQAPKITVSAKVSKAGVVKIIAQTPGIVSEVNVSNGQEVSQGTTLVSLANNYQGGNTLTAARELAATQYFNSKNTYDTQKDIIQKQRSLADAQKENTDALREISTSSNKESEALVNLNNEIIKSIRDNISFLQSNNVGGANDAAIQSAKGMQAQLQAGNNQLEQMLIVSQFQTNTNNPPAQMANITHDMAIEQLDLQEKALKMGLEAGRLQLEMAQIAESTMYPAAPFDGVVQEVHVNPGQNVNPGTLLVTISSFDNKATVIAKVPKEVGNKVSKLEESTLYIGSKSYQMLPSYVSSEATDGNLSTVIFNLPEEEFQNTTDSQYLKVDIPIGYPDTVKASTYVPIDSVYQTQEGAYIYVVMDGKVKAKKVTLGSVLGGTVEIIKGLVNGDRVILDRTVGEGDQVSVENSYGKQ